MWDDSTEAVFNSNSELLENSKKSTTQVLRVLKLTVFQRFFADSGFCVNVEVGQSVIMTHIDA
jgi:hypothetical protein